MSQISIKQFEQRRIIEDYMHQMEEQERQVNKDYLLRVIKRQADNINKYDEDWDAPVVVSAPLQQIGKKHARSNTVLEI